MGMFRFISIDYGDRKHENGVHVDTVRFRYESVHALIVNQDGALYSGHVSGAILKCVRFHEAARPAFLKVAPHS